MHDHRLLVNSLCADVTRCVSINKGRGISKLRINNIIVTLQMAEIDDLELYGLAAAAVAVTLASVFRNRLAF